MPDNILKQRLQKDRDEKQAATQKVDSMQSLKPEGEERELVDALIRKTSQDFRGDISSQGFTPDIQAAIEQSIRAEAEKISDSYEEQARITKITLGTIIGLGPIEPFMQDPDVEDIIVQTFDNIVVVKKGVKYNTDASFTDEAHLITVIDRIIQQIGRQINLFTPKVDARLADGYRVNATIRPISPDGATLTIRKFPDKGFTGQDYLRFGTIDEKMLIFLQNCIAGKANLMVGGGTGTGKTSLLNMLSEYIPGDELIVTIEDSCELRLKQRNVRRLEARDSIGEASAVTIQDLVKNSLRMMVDRVIVGETRDGTIVDLFSAMSTGHEGSISTIHCNNPLNMVNSRIPTLYSMYKDGSFSPEGQAIQISEALDVIVHIKRFKSGLRAVTHITAVDGVDERNPARVKLVDIFRYDEANRVFNATGYVPEKLLKKLAENDVVIDRQIFRKTTETEHKA
jgi:Flp pilus assembly CpaF family ATPase